MTRRSTTPNPPSSWWWASTPPRRPRSSPACPVSLASPIPAPRSGQSPATCASPASVVALPGGELSCILRGEDDRLIVVVGPCSIHAPGAEHVYARRLAPLAA